MREDIIQRNIRDRTNPMDGMDTTAVCKFTIHNPALRISRKKGVFLDLTMSAILTKKGTLIIPRYEVWG